MDIMMSLFNCHLLCCFVYFLFLGDFLSGATARKIRRTCIESEMEIFSPHGVRIEPYYKSHVEMLLSQPKHNHKTKFYMKMEFKTDKPDGVLFYSRHETYTNELIGLTLEDGYLVYKVQCPTLHADILIPTNHRLNDSRWHTVSYSAKSRRFSQYGVIHIDDSSTFKRYEVTCQRMTSIVLGGHSPKDADYMRSLRFTQGHFDGCIRNLKFPIALKTPPKYYAVSVC